MTVANTHFFPISASPAWSMGCPLCGGVANASTTSAGTCLCGHVTLGPVDLKQFGSTKDSA